MQLLDDIGSRRAEQRQKWIFWSACFLGWFALVTVTASFMSLATSWPFSFTSLLALGFWGFYALAAPVVLWFARRFPLNRHSWRANMWKHLAGLVGFIVLCEGGFASLIYQLEPRAIAIILSRDQWTSEFGAPSSSTLAAEDLAERLEGGLPKPSMRIVVLTKLQLGIAFYWVLVGVAHSQAAQAALREREKQAAQLTAHLTQAQLAGLRTQLQPHFLFNTLNSIAALIPQNAKLATEMVMNLSDLLRMTLREPPRGEIQLREEVQLLRHYVDIQKLRFGEKLAFQVEATEAALGAFVPPLLLQPLVENAIRHGLEITGQAERIIVRSELTEQGLRLEVANTFSADPEETPPAGESTGVGLANVRARLEVQYGDRHRFQSRPLAGGGFQVSMLIPIHSALQPESLQNA